MLELFYPINNSRQEWSDRIVPETCWTENRRVEVSSTTCGITAGNAVLYGTTGYTVFSLTPQRQRTI